MRKRILSVLLAGCLLLSVGCSARENDSAAETTEASSEVTINTYHETMPVPEDGWTTDLISEVFYINGKNVPFPFTIEDLGEGFEWEYDSTSTNDEGKIDVLSMHYHGQVFAFVTLINDPVYENELNSAKIRNVTFNYEGSEQLVFLNGITIGSKYDEVIKSFGENNIPQEDFSFIKYYFSDCKLFFSMKDNRVNGIYYMEDKSG